MGNISVRDHGHAHRAPDCADPAPDGPGPRLRSAAADVLARYAEALKAEGHPLVELPELWPDTRARAALLLAECAGALDATARPRTCGHLDRVRPAEASFHELGARWAAAEIGLVDCLSALDRLTEALVAAVAAAGREPGAAHAQDIVRRVSARHTRAAAHGYETRLRAHRPAPGDDCCGRLARDVHDHLGGSLALAFRHLELHRLKARTAGADDPGTERHLAAIHDALQEATALTRGLVTGLRDTHSTAQDGLEESLRRHADRLNLAGLPLRLTVEGDARRVPPAHRREIVLVVGEFLRNSFAHADPQAVTIGVRISRHRVEVQATDDGRGFRYDVHREHRGGLTAMRERVAQMGGRSLLLSAPRKGTRLLLWVPLTSGHGPHPGETWNSFAS
ncbi:ATP-binding protein [Streptomyces sp. KS 21]|uniref:sensor histidine kinase n=1 Tax=Streptomyces sp. KS 21 TaxID=2485150 RepID=UPI0010D637C7|nr:ATP-binding protein [Streptomyces sp. KS 21]TDU74634.1 histidine kinase [Streptomyces sp. KS 21]